MAWILGQLNQGKPVIGMNQKSRISKAYVRNAYNHQQHAFNERGKKDTFNISLQEVWNCRLAERSTMQCIEE
jgi:hypothetical protein